MAMTEYDRAPSSSIPDLIRSLLVDIRDLIREEIALARAELREELATIRVIGVALGAAVFAGLLGVVILCIAIGGAIAYALNWPTWIGYGIVAILLLAGAFVLALYGRAQLTRVRPMPRTTETVKENLAWMQSKSVTR